MGHRPQSARPLRDAPAATDLERRYVTGEGWRTVVADEAGGGGGDLPDWWTVDSTPGAESVEFAGEVLIQPSYATDHAFTVVGGPGALANANELFRVKDDQGTQVFGVDALGGVGYAMVSTPFPGSANWTMDGYQIAEFGADWVKLIAQPGIPIRLSPATVFDDVVKIDDTGRLAFWDAPLADKPTGVAATGPGVHAALVTLGLIAA